MVAQLLKVVAVEDEGNVPVTVMVMLLPAPARMDPPTFTALPLPLGPEVIVACPFAVAYQVTLVSSAGTASVITLFCASDGPWLVAVIV
jgi:hypothetical protein